MNSDQWKQVWRIFEQAAVLPAGDRHAFARSRDLDAESLTALLDLIDNGEHFTVVYPSKVGHYHVGRVIGRGGNGVVHAARDEILDRQVALKFLNTSLMGARPAVERFLREARTISALNHLNIVTIYDIIQEDSRIAIAMELIEGKALSEWQGMAVPVQKVIEWGRQIALALEAAHSRELMHRDIKPENILVRGDGVVKVLDFGLARGVHDESFTPGTPLGTMRYMSPEQTAGTRLTTASDIFSLGIVLYELATGRHPFPAPTPFESAQAISSGTATPPSRIVRLPRQFDALVMAMLNRDPASRPTSAQVASQLSAMVKAPVMRGRGAWAAAVAVLGTTLGLGAYLYRGGAPPASPEGFGRPLTSQFGWESNPALSPDGQWIAFLWSRDRKQARGLYVKRVDEGDSPLKVAGEEPGARIGPPAWSPDGLQLAFARAGGADGPAIYAVGRGGGNSRRLVELQNAQIESAIDWSFDGSTLAFSDLAPGRGRRSIYLYRLPTGERRMLTDPSAGDRGDEDPRFSPDGLTVAFRRVIGRGQDQLLLVSTAGGAARKLTPDPVRRSIRGHAWAPDGKSVLVSEQRGGAVQGLWRYRLAASGGPERIAEGALDFTGPAVSRDSGHVAWASELTDFNIWRLPLNGGAGGPVISSTMRDLEPSLSPSGRLAFLSDRSGAAEIWLASADGKTQVRPAGLGGRPAGTPAWSPDGSKLVLSASNQAGSDLYLLECPPDGVSCGELRQLTYLEGNEVFPAWSADGKSILYVSDRGGWNIWRISVTGGDPSQVTTDGAQRAIESSDGKWLYVSAAAPGKGIYRVAASGASSKDWLIGEPWNAAPEDWTVCGGELVFFDRDAGGLQAMDLTTRKVRVIAASAGMAIEHGKSGLSAAPGGASVLFSRLERSQSNILLAGPEVLR